MNNSCFLPCLPFFLLDTSTLGSGSKVVTGVLVPELGLDPHPAPFEDGAGRLKNSRICALFAAAVALEGNDGKSIALDLAPFLVPPNGFVRAGVAELVLGVEGPLARGAGGVKRELLLDHAVDREWLPPCFEDGGKPGYAAVLLGKPGTEPAARCTLDQMSLLRWPRLLTAALRGCMGCVTEVLGLAELEEPPARAGKESCRSG